jgi:outer membrane receptor for ferrienterochelin and colicins
MKSHFTRMLLPVLICAVSATSYGDNKPSGSKSAASMDVYNLSLAELGQVQISIATGNSTPLDKAPATASVIYAAQIEAMGARNLDEVLETVPGLHISLSALSRLDSVESIRGIHTGFNPQVLMMLNGVPVQGSVTGGRPVLFRLPVASIERVEVIRGPGSAVYGADAYAGVVNVITKDSAAIGSTRMGARVGSFNSKDAWLQMATQWQGLGIAFDVALSETDGDKSRKVSADLQSALDAALGTHASLTPSSLSTRYHVVDSHLAVSDEKLQFNLWNWVSTNAGIGAGAAQALDPMGRDDSHLWLSDFTYHFNKSAVWDNSVRLSYMQYDQRAQFTLLPAGTVVPIGKDGNVDFVAPVGVSLFVDGLKGSPGGISKDSQLDVVSIYSGFDSQRIRMAIGARQQSVEVNESKNFGPGVLDKSPLPPVVTGNLTDVTGTPYIFLANSSRSEKYLSLQDEWQVITDVDLTAGMRYDDYSDFGSTINPRVALVWSADEKLTTKLMLGSAFRAPSFSELYYKNNPVSLGNPAVSPEKINSQELSFNYRPVKEVQATLTLFSYQARDMIDFVADSGATTKIAQNKNAQDAKGFELELNWKPSLQWQLSTSYSLQQAQDTETNKAIPDAPSQQIKANANWLFANDWSLNSQLYWVGHRARALGDTRAAIADYTLVNFALNRKDILPDVGFSFAVRNATNADAREPSSGTIPNDYPLELRSLWLGLTFSFK